MNPSIETINSNCKPWYREFWVWFILAPLITVVIVSSFTITVAVKGADDRVIDDYYKEGRMINHRMDQDLLAQALNVSANVQFDQALGELSLQLFQDIDNFPSQLALELSHPAQAELDQRYVLNRIAANQYQVELPEFLVVQPLQHRWYLRLKPVSEGVDQTLWRLRGEIDFNRNTQVQLSSSQAKIP